MASGPEIVAGYNSAKSIFDIAKGFFALKSEAEKNAAILNIQREALATQEAYSAALKRIENLEQEIVRLENWESEKQRYQLSAIGARAVAYTHKPGMEDVEAPHWLCQPCFDKGHKTALQFDKIVSSDAGRGLMSEWTCSDCRGKIKAGRNARLSDPSTW